MQEAFYVSSGFYCIYCYTYKPELNAIRRIKHLFCCCAHVLHHHKPKPWPSPCLSNELICFWITHTFLAFYAIASLFLLLERLIFSLMWALNFDKHWKRLVFFPWAFLWSSCWFLLHNSRSQAHLRNKKNQPLSSLRNKSIGTDVLTFRDDCILLLCSHQSQFPASLIWLSPRCFDCQSVCSERQTADGMTQLHI